MTDGSRSETLEKASDVQDELLADGSMILYHPSTQRLVTLNPTAALIWEYCDGVHTLPMIADEVCEIFPDAANAAEDVLQLVRDLQEQGMIVRGIR